MCGLLYMEKIPIPARSVFVGYVDIQHNGAEWEGDHVVRYHLYLILRSIQIIDAVSFACTWSFGVMEPSNEGSSNDGKDIQWSSKTEKIPSEYICHVFLLRLCKLFSCCIKCVCLLYTISLFSVLYILLQFRSVHCDHIFFNIMLLHVGTSFYIAFQPHRLSYKRSSGLSRRADKAIAFTASLLVLSCTSAMNCVCCAEEMNLTCIQNFRTGLL